MKKYLFVILIGINFLSFSQISYEFGKPIPVDGLSIQTVTPSFYGVYQNENPQYKYEVNEKGIFIHTINIQAISRETLRENAQYEVRNGCIFGVTEDSIPYVFQDDSYYFGVRNTVQLVGGEAENQLIEMKRGDYVLNFKTENGYTPALFSFQNNSLAIAYFDYEDETKEFKKVKETSTIEANLKTVVLYPTLKEWEKITSKVDLFGESDQFQKVIE